MTDETAGTTVEDEAVLAGFDGLLAAARAGVLDVEAARRYLAAAFAVREPLRVVRSALRPGDIEPHDDVERSVRVVRSAYAWALDVDGRLCGLVAGDQGYESTHVVVPPEDLEHWAKDRARRTTGPVEASRDARDALASWISRSPDAGSDAKGEALRRDAFLAGFSSAETAAPVRPVGWLHEARTDGPSGYEPRFAATSRDDAGAPADVRSVRRAFEPHPEPEGAGRAADPVLLEIADRLERFGETDGRLARSGLLRAADDLRVAASFSRVRAGVGPSMPTRGLPRSAESRRVHEGRERVMTRWDAWRRYVADGGRGSWPRDEFECLLDVLMPEPDDRPKEVAGALETIGIAAEALEANGIRDTAKGLSAASEALTILLDSLLGRALAAEARAADAEYALRSGAATPHALRTDRIASARSDGKEAARDG